MRIAAISDIHGDYRALMAVWADIEARGLDCGPVLNAGDTVAYGRDTMTCVNFVRDASRNIVSVCGNYDGNTAGFPAKQEKFRRKWGKLRPEKYRALKDASEDLTVDARSWLLDMPRVKSIELEGVRISLSHYAPTVGKEGLFAETSEDRLLSIVDELNGSCDIVIVGHTHSAFVRTVGGVFFVNPGTVGRSSASPTYAEVEFGPGTCPKARIIACHVSLH
jgi:putative phosphoesterase